MGDTGITDDKELQQLIKANMPYFSIQSSSGKVECKLNGHCFPPKAEALKAFVNGAKYQKLRTRHEAENVLAKYEPFIIKSKNFPNKLYCTLTVQLLDQSIAAIKLHMSGQKFKRAKDRFLDDKQELKEEPNISGPGDFPEDEDMADAQDGDSDGAADEDSIAETAANGVAHTAHPHKAGGKGSRRASSGAAADPMEQDVAGEEEAGSSGSDAEDEGDASEGGDEDEIVFEDVFDEPAPPLRLRNQSKGGLANGSRADGTAADLAGSRAAAGISDSAAEDVKEIRATVSSKSKKANGAASGDAAVVAPTASKADKLTKAERQAAADAAEAAALAGAQRQQRTKAPKKQNASRPSSSKRRRS